MWIITARRIRASCQSEIGQTAIWVYYTFHRYIVDRYNDFWFGRFLLTQRKISWIGWSYLVVTFELRHLLWQKYSTIQRIPAPTVFRISHLFRGFTEQSIRISLRLQLSRRSLWIKSSMKLGGLKSISTILLMTILAARSSSPVYRVVLVPPVQFTRPRRADSAPRGVHRASRKLRPPGSQFDSAPDGGAWCFTIEQDPRLPVDCW